MVNAHRPLYNSLSLFLIFFYYPVTVVFFPLLHSVSYLADSSSCWKPRKCLCSQVHHLPFFFLHDLLIAPTYTFDDCQLSWGYVVADGSHRRLLLLYRLSFSSSLCYWMTGEHKSWADFSLFRRERTLSYIVVQQRNGRYITFEKLLLLLGRLLILWVGISASEGQTEKRRMRRRVSSMYRKKRFVVWIIANERADNYPRVAAATRCSQGGAYFSPLSAVDVVTTTKAAAHKKPLHGTTILAQWWLMTVE